MKYIFSENNIKLYFVILRTPYGYAHSYMYTIYIYILLLNDINTIKKNERSK